MADAIDDANAMAALHLDQSLAASLAAAAAIPAGVPGECSDCGGDSPRLVNGLCAPCREPRRRR